MSLLDYLELLWLASKVFQDGMGFWLFCCLPFLVCKGHFLHPLKKVTLVTFMSKGEMEKSLAFAEARINAC